MCICVWVSCGSQPENVGISSDLSGALTVYSVGLTDDDKMAGQTISNDDNHIPCVS